MKLTLQHIGILVIGLAASCLGQQTAQDLIHQLQPMSIGGDAAVREDLRQMTLDVMAPPVDESARTAHEFALQDGINRITDIEI
jgi:hypothetical protein